MLFPVYDPRVAQPLLAGAPHQEVRFCRTADGVRIAYAVHGSGPVLVVATCWLSHLLHDWQSPVWRHFLADLGQFATVVRYDERGHGLSDPDVTDYGLGARVSDLEAVVEDAGVDRFALMGMAQGGPVAVSYTVAHPERVDRLAFYGSYAAALRDPTPEALAESAAFEQLIKVGWARPDSVFRRVFTSLMIPGATEEQMRWLDELQRVSVSAENAVAARAERNRADVTDLLARLDVPTLVLHSRGDRMNDFDEGRRLAGGIRGARLVPLESENHILLADEPAWPVFLAELREFLAEPASGPALGATPLAGVLSPRELDVLELVARGQDNEQVAQALTLSVRTVERHLQNVYVKLDLSGRTARAAAVGRLLGMGAGTHVGAVGRP